MIKSFTKVLSTSSLQWLATKILHLKNVYRDFSMKSKSRKISLFSTCTIYNIKIILYLLRTSAMYGVEIIVDNVLRLHKTA